MNCSSILIVDDDRDIREALRDALEMEGYATSIACNGQEALDFLRSCSPAERPGIIILDLSMPVMDGKSFLKHVNMSYQDDLGHIPVIVASANINYGNEEGLNFARVKLKKPVDLDSLHRAVLEHCGPPPSANT